MKKLFSILLCALMIASLAIVASGAADGNGYIKCMIEDAELIDDDTTQDQGGSGNPIQIVDGYGCGYSSLNDIVAFHDIDFGDFGASSIQILFSYGHDDDSKTTLDIKLDDPDSAAIAKFEIGFTGGWTADQAQWFEAACAIPAGIHSVYIQFTNEKSGSFTQVAFKEAAPTGYISLSIDKAELIDDDTTQDQGGSGNPIQIVDGYGCGYSSKNDIVAYNDVDFGANGAQAMDLLFGYGNNDGSVTTLSFMLDDPSSAPIATAEIGFTGGWEIANAGWVRVPMTIPAGVHTVYVQFTSEKSGSISDIVFEEAPEAPAAAVDTSASPDTVTTAPATFDAGVLAALAAIVSAAGFALSKKH